MTTLKHARERYTKLDPRTHVLKRPDTYIGSIEFTEQPMYIYDSQTEKIVKRTIPVNDGLKKIFEEPLNNTYDHYWRVKGTDNPQVTTIDITVGSDVVIIHNDGLGIEPVESKEPGVKVIELVFGHLLAGENFDDTQHREGGGRNGLGSKATNIMSKRFMVESCHDNIISKASWSDNMGVFSGVTETPAKKGTKDYTRVTFYPDFKRFGCEQFSETDIGLFHKLAIDLGMTIGTKGGLVTVKFNGDTIKIRGLEQYTSLYFPTTYKKLKYEYQESKVLICDGSVTNALSESESPPPSGTVSFVNGIYTSSGGVHSAAWANALLKPAVEKLKSKYPKLTVTKILKKVMLFVVCTVSNPQFESQSKKELVKPAPKVTVIADPVITKLIHLPWVKLLKDSKSQEDTLELKKTDAKKDSHLKILDAVNAGQAGKKGVECVMYLTEGKSAKGMIVAAMPLLQGGADLNGAFPLTGKVLNTDGKSAEKVNENKELTAIKQLIGLETGVDYTHAKSGNSKGSLRYMKVALLPDQDYDGSHIRGLLIRYFVEYFPSFVKAGRLVGIITPIMKVMSSKGPIFFYDLEKARAYITDHNVPKKRVKYYKGLGTIDPTDYPYIFSKDKYIEIRYTYGTPDDKAALFLAFSKKQADQRKQWLYGQTIQPVPYDYTQIKELSVAKFINHELKAYSLRSIQRMLSSIIDGLKEGQRKILFAAFKRKLTEPIKVMQLSGYVAEHTAYQHGEQNLESTQVNMAHSFRFTNNAPLLKIEGNGGNSFFGGKDAASGRYIYITLSSLARKLFHPDDDALMTPQQDDGIDIEPEFYIPVIPMILVNTTISNISTGWASSAPAYKVLDIIALLKAYATHSQIVLPVPGWVGYTGKVEMIEDCEDGASTGYITHGKYERDGNTIIVTELPGDTTPEAFYKKAQAWQADGVLTGLSQKCVGNFVINFELELAPGQQLTDAQLGMTAKGSLRSMVFLNRESQPIRYTGIMDILHEWVPIRLEYYEKRIAYLIAKYKAESLELRNTVRYIQKVNKKKIKILKQTREAIIIQLQKYKFDTIDNSYKYLTHMPIDHLSDESIQKMIKTLKYNDDMIAQLESTTPTEAWFKDLDELEIAYKNYLKELYTNDEKSIQKITSLDEVKASRTGKSGSRVRRK